MNQDREHDGSYYGGYRPGPDEIRIQEHRPQKEDEDHQPRFRWFWDPPETDPRQAVCGPWFDTPRAARDAGNAWLRQHR